MTAETKKENGKKKILVLDDEPDGPILALENFKAGIYDFYWISKCKNGWLAFPRK
jgi:hypothetical protein